MIKILFLSAIAFLLFSCNPGIHKKQTMKLNLLLSEVRYLEYDLKTLRTDSFPFFIQNIKESVEKINNCKSCTPDQEFHNQFLIPFNDAGLNFNNSFTTFRKLIERLRESEKQVSNLKYDIGKGLIAKKEFGNYFSQEKEVIDAIFKDIISTRQSYFYNLSLYHRLRPVINKKLDQITLGKK